MGVGYLVTGNPGSGKSTVAHELMRRGFTAIDPDQDAELSYWVNEQGERTLLSDGPSSPDLAWLHAHRWVWGRQRLCARLAEHEGAVFVCGIALNIHELADLFEQIVLLQIEAATQEERLAAYDAAHPPGRNAAGRQQIRDGRPVFQAEMLQLGAVAVDAAHPPAVVTDRVLRAIGLG